MSGDELIKLIPKWAKVIGPRKAKRLLITEDVGASTADFMVRGEYHSSPGEEMEGKIRRAMSEFLVSLEAS